MNCPKCTSSRISSNKFEPISEEHLRNGAQAAQITKHPAIAAGIAAYWALTQAVNGFRHDWRCDHCDHRFSEA
ncbi:hypothetical protein PQ455_03395 [Sphingomonas naphthae]|uniref:Uncharacterized protein n=1 Tax=Sphingomonas naphthae TaxID=1813468 RepID=A0ABY7TMR6_9SPHN|nr:hypothetical protein [Sphingomonas naphthae]WCT74286.1 hypothetical protein PQ455_03395 [Sphingomonas naphthae]